MHRDIIEIDWKVQMELGATNPYHIQHTNVEIENAD